MIRQIVVFLSIASLLGAISCGASKNQDDVRSEIEPHLTVGKTTRSDVVAIMREKKYHVLDEPNMPNLFNERKCEYMPASHVEERFFGRFLTVIDFCFDPETKILDTYRINKTTGGPMLFP